MIAAVLFALALAGDVILAFVRPSCPAGWTSFDLEPGISLIVGIPVGLLLLVSIGASVRARRSNRVPGGGLPVGTVLGALLVLLATASLALVASSVVVQVENPNADCITF